MGPKSKAQLLQTLQITNVDNIGENFHNFYTNFSNGHSLKTVNAQYCSIGYRIQPAYQQQMTAQFSQNIFANIDFTKENVTGQMIDKYVGQQTAGEIVTVVLPSDLDADTDLAVVTVVSFEGNLLKPFSPFLTKREVFNVQIWNPVVSILILIT